MGISSQLMAAVFSLILGLEGNSGMPIAILDRIEDTQQFWARSAAILCQKTGDNFCEEQVRFMTANTEPTGMSRIIEYSTDGGATTKRVCAILPPIDQVDPTSVGEAFGTGFPAFGDQPGSEDTQAWLTLYHAAHCLDTEGSAFEEKRAAAFATLGLIIIDADPRFAAGMVRSPPRQMAVISGQEAAYWAAGVGERLLLDLWKGEAVERLRDEFGCDAVVEANSSIDIERIAKESQLKSGEDCRSQDPAQTGNGTGEGSSGGGSAKGVVSDRNIWIWMYGTGGLGVPPKPWTPMKMFSSTRSAAKYTIDAAESLARQK